MLSFLLFSHFRKCVQNDKRTLQLLFWVLFIFGLTAWFPWLNISISCIACVYEGYISFLVLASPFPLPFYLSLSFSGSRIVLSKNLFLKFRQEVYWTTITVENATITKTVRMKFIAFRDRARGYISLPVSICRYIFGAWPSALCIHTEIGRTVLAYLLLGFPFYQPKIYVCV